MQNYYQKETKPVIKYILVSLLAIVVGILCGLGLIKSVELFQAEMGLMKSEHECIGKLIALEHERSTIQHGNGTCWVQYGLVVNHP